MSIDWQELVVLPLPHEPKFPTAFRAARLRTGLSQGEFAEKLSIGVNNIGRYERDLSRPTKATYSAICQLLSELLGDEQFACDDSNGSKSDPRLKAIKDASVEEMVEELKKHRGATDVQIRF
ncbi:helix-turn-helix transcriptional regulator [Ferrimonas pelagia]|uniref:HTH cro/C1-type domain-containing protein n=1 Tax=Ferrimonas pelagia TaxID=1177826 RepID=A0ABP9EK34_9GAMM